MALIIKLRSLSNLAGYYWLIDTGTQLAPLTFDDLTELPEIGETDTVAVIIPGDQVLNAYTEIPNYGNKQIRRALPYALEEQLSEPVESLYFALGSYKNGEQNAFVINKALWQNLLQACKAARIKPDIIVPDYLACTWQPQTLTIARDSQLTSIRYQQEKGLSLGYSTAKHSLPHLLADDTTTVNAYGTIDALDLPESVSLVRANPDPLQAIDLDGLLTSPVNLLQGDYRPKPKQSRSRRAWRWLLYVVIAWLVVWVGSHIAQTIALKQQNAALNQAMLTTYQRVFPGHTDMVEPRFMLNRELKKYVHSTAHNPALHTMKLVGLALQTVPAASVEAIQYKDKQTTVILTVNDASDIVTFTHSLKSYGLRLGKNSQKPDGSLIKATIIIKG